MMHGLAVGIFQPGSIFPVPLRPLDLDLVMPLLHEFGEVQDDGTVLLEGRPVRFLDGYVELPWQWPHRIRAAEEIAKRLHALGCTVCDTGSRRVIHDEEIRSWQ